MDLDQKYVEALEWIHGLGRFGIKPGLERVTTLLENLGNPHSSLKFVHVGGTNGKGSTAVMLTSILRAAGYKVGLYTSPYLLSFTNRMAVNGDDIDRAELVSLVEEVRPHVEIISEDPDLGDMTEFEVVTVLAFCYFARQNTDLVVLEVGLGGRLDATNVITPLLSVITNISLEHTDILGDTIEKIAYEKAGIIKAGRPLVTAAADDRALGVFKKRCSELGSPLHRVYPFSAADEGVSGNKPRAFSGKVTSAGQYFSYSGFSLQLDDLFIPLRGSYQLDNAATALAAAEILFKEGFSISIEEIKEGLAETIWPGRLELLAEKPLLIMDGAHNPAAMDKLATAIRAYFSYDKLILVYGMLADKDMESMLKSILPQADTVVFTRPVLPRAAEPAAVADYAVKKLGFKKQLFVVNEFGAALEKAIDLAEPDDAVLVTGSLYTVSDIRAYWIESRASLGR
jgi:dihydrofolate synthase / folylpolyglutamate synthase